MTVNYTTNLSLGQPVTGTESGTWGDDVNNAVTSYLDIAISGSLALTSASFTANALTLANTQGTSSTTNIGATTAQYYVLRLSSLAANVTITAPSVSKTYLVVNTDSTYYVTIKASGQTGTSVVAGERAMVYFNGTDYIKVTSSVLSNLAGVLPVTSGGTGVTTSTGTGNVVLSTSPTLVTPALGTPASGVLTNATGLPISTGVSGLGTGVATALAVNTGTAGAVVVNGGALGTPASGTATNLTGLPISTGVAGLGTGVATALAVNTGTAGSVVVNGGALGTPASGAATNLTGLPLSTGVTGTLAATNGGTGQSSYAVGDLVYASTTTALSKLADVATGSALISGGVGVAPSYGKIGLTTHVSGTLPVANGGTGVTTSTGSGNNVLSTSPTLVTPVLGTPTSATLTNATGLPLTTGVTGTLPVANGGTGVTTSTGTGSVVKATSPTIDAATLTGASTIQGLTVGFGAGAVSTNTVLGYSALSANTTGDYNTVVGFGSAASNTLGGSNCVFGNTSFSANTSGGTNSAFGRLSLNTNITGSSNAAFGFRALQNSTGNNNTAIQPMNGTTYAPVFDPTTHDNRFCMGSTSVTNAYIQVAWTVVSDARDKTDFADVPHGLNFVTKLKPTAYRYKENRESTKGHGPLRYGFKAQDVLALEGDNPVIVDAEDSEKLRFNDQAMIAVLVNAIKELKAEFDEYKNTHP